MSASSGEYEHLTDEDLAAVEAELREAYRRLVEPKPLPGGDEHPHWCKCQRVCGGDQ